MLRRILALALVALITGLAFLPSAQACPFCSAVAQTFTEEIDSMDVAVIARLIEAPPPQQSFDAGDELPKAKFAVVEALKGEAHLGKTKKLEAVYFGSAPKGSLFLLMAVDPPNLAWSTPLALSERAHEYLKELVQLPRDYAKSDAKYAERLKFFVGHLEDKDDLLARDAYDEFARAPYAAVIALKEDMDREQLVTWIRNTDIPASRRRLYLTMLGVCGTEDDLPLLEEMLHSSDRKQKAGLDALIACYLTLKGPDGMPLIEELFLKNEAADYADTYAAVMALRFHGTEAEIVPKDRILQGFRLMLERPKLADLVIPDLARWEDWQSLPRLVKLFKESDEKTSWVRVPVINFLRACPLPEAAIALKELEQIDPVAVRRATTFFPVAPQPPADESGSSGSGAGASSGAGSR